MIPIRDENRSLTTPHITRVIIIVNVVIFLISWLSGSVFFQNFVKSYGMIPLSITQGKQLHTLFTSMFLHGGFMHLIGNMLYLYIFGDNVEDSFGHGRYFIFYVLCGLVASVTYIVSITNPKVLLSPTIGASGAISGVLGAYLVLYPRARILTMVFYYWIALVPIPAIFFLGFWFIFQLLAGTFEPYGGVAYWAHIGGFVAGVALALIFKRKRKPPLSPLSLSIREI